MLVNNPKEIAHQSPRVAGNAVYMARVMLNIDTIDTETYSAKSMNISTNILYDLLKLYPNPSSKFIHYQLPILENEKGKVRILDVSGKLIKQWKVDSQNTIGSIDISHYSKGIYLFELNLNNGKSFIKKLVVN